MPNDLPAPGQFVDFLYSRNYPFDCHRFLGFSITLKGLEERTKKPLRYMINFFLGGDDPKITALIYREGFQEEFLELFDKDDVLAIIFAFEKRTGLGA